ncbi:MAG: GNAT family N-acetyltransferase [Candidatus Thiodiazotropha lotti]|nr:GNAT family N-acetyltransferase [Candidatus Thiodiazotropha lotti]MCG8002223.1 GNAT family N-acetyltransferase [Candidatus Thiodiazotropha lotti]MCG8008833.1 GNAT family N-acetyltransferase [Candidatus Thiodiazotropha lotti]MCW4185842.1 GNAT family N-acetyltransferase [Candidatus Thiodiazotropha lotti]MCW4196421.1 GNAT family N-acetyltransferase [Candidatus Thiodiazotropha lotti]
MTDSIPAIEFVMKNGIQCRVQPCVEPNTRHTAEFLKKQIEIGFQHMSARSRFSRFATALDHLTDQQLDYLTDLDGKDRVAWCASITSKDEESGIGIARYINLPNEARMAEFAITVVDDYQGLGVGYQLLNKLIESAKLNGFQTLRGYILMSNSAMLALCKRFKSKKTSVDGSFVIVDIIVQ